MNKYRMPSRILGGLCLAALAAAGPNCLPKRVYWSPDGQQAVILNKEQTWIAGADGKIQGPSAVQLEQVAWFADSHAFVGVRAQAVTKWAEAEKMLSPEQLARLAKLQGEFREQILKHEGSWEGFVPGLSQNVTDIEYMALWIYVRDHDDGSVRSKLGEKWSDYAGLGLMIRSLEEWQVQDGQLKEGRRLAQTLYEIGGGSVHISPDQKLVAYVVRNAYKVSEKTEEQIESPSDAGGSLMLVTRQDKSEPQTVAPFAAWRSDFSPDSRSLVYATTTQIPQGDSLVLGSIQRREVAGEHGEVQIRDPRAEDHLAGIIYFPDTKITCLQDGRILFSAASISLPVSNADMPTGATLFSLDPERRATLAPMLTRAVEAKAPMDGFAYANYEISPDGRAVTMIEIADKGQVAFYSFPRGDLEYVVETEGWKLSEEPAWRNNQEISLVVPPGHKWGSPNRAEFVLYNLETKQTRIISKDWPGELMNAFTPDRSQSQPAASQPDEGGNK